MAATAASSSMATTSATALIPRFPTSTAAATRTLRFSALPSLSPRLPARSFSTYIKHASDVCRFSMLQIRASSDETSPVDANEIFTDLKEKWDAIENKSTVLLYGGGAIVAVWLSSIIVGAINSVPLLPKIMELVGLGYTGWFVYRYLLFKVNCPLDSVLGWSRCSI
uniref:Cyanobacterial aminoacyl-tRNA synthetase CAAD domain-containing protein n=1 Tax=Rhizophora mucronata TaxID=61149 RepID=A0A2P2LB26_RHIMU